MRRTPEGLHEGRMARAKSRPCGVEVGGPQHRGLQRGAGVAAPDEGRASIGRKSLESQRDAGIGRVMVGLVMDEKGVLRHGQAVVTDKGVGEVLSGTFSPSLGKAIAFARIPAGVVGDVRVDIRGREVPVRVVKYPFVRDGQAISA